MEVEAMNKKYVVRLADDERQQLRAMTRRGRVVAYKVRHAQTLLQADVEGPGWTDAQIVEAVGCHVGTAENVRRRFVLAGLEAALERKKQVRPSRERILDGEGEARLIALACGPAPEGRTRWTLELLADELVRWKVVDSIAVQTVRRTLKKTNCGLTGKGAG